MQVGKVSIKPTNHYLIYHQDVEWCLVLITILSPTKTLKNLRYGKDRFTYIKQFKKYLIKVHTKFDEIEQIMYVINAFKTKK
ncbi:MAG: hypothetical protein KKA65_04820 [Nanoarchaeota archaeon]|nr:hypothetical protein [Nanoarchaeota archaeon]MBU4242619.1 hypothetical protein [Nanoarchaeota archaeon]MBU4351655.1 hypothetical protein [Nanoarchaeota archaeon]MBU4456799.1 hypothetical protein [Nanoarchaeota archaeon]MCG2719808.1 hypothetical protein [Nanoarchaeota archaeon]